MVGFMASGKGSVAQELGQLLGRPVIDTDDMIAAAAGETIPQVFARKGESGFRRLEAVAVRGAASVRRAIIATGGGAVLDNRNVRALRDSGTVIWLRAEAEAILQRTGAGTPVAASRPLLAGLAYGDAASRVSKLMGDREPAYSGAADITVDTTGRLPHDVANEICARLGLAPRGPGVSLRQAIPSKPDLPSQVACGEGLLSDGQLFGRLPDSVRRRKCLLVTDPLVASLYGRLIGNAARLAGVALEIAHVPRGERAKRLRVVEGLYESMLESGLGRDGLILALGGGAVGDAAGFAAATYMRGIPFVQLPTTLLAQVDSALGGKTAVDLGLHKNTVGAFHQPVAVIADTACLTTLPARELRSGLAEALKYGLIYDAALWEDVAAWGRAQNTPGTPQSAQARTSGSCIAASVISRCLAHKAAVAAADERDTGPREALNFGHTLGHALEASAAGKLRHGEAVAWGMHFAVWYGERTGVTTSGVLPAVARGLAGSGFAPPRGGGTARELVSLMLKDKKVRGGRIRLILLQELGLVHGAAIEVDRGEVERAVSEWLELDHRKHWRV